LFRQDMLMRQIRMLADVLARAVFLRRTGRDREALVEIEAAGMLHDPETTRPLSGLSDKETVDLARTPEGIHLEAADRLADLLLLAAEIYEEDDRLQDARDARQKALLLTSICAAEIHGLPPDHLAERLERLSRNLDIGLLSDQHLRNLHLAFEKLGRLDRAEDVLFLIADRDLATAEALGIAFYDRLKTLTPTRLRRGNLPLNEVEEGRKALLRRVRSGDP
jgi:hypothetical protein